MPLLSVCEPVDDVRIGLWKIEEPTELLLSRYPHLEQVVSGYRSPERKQQKLSVYALLYSMLGDSYLVITHNENGKPLLAGFNISISDTKGFVAVILSRERTVAVDIEYMSTRVGRIVSRFVRPDEMAADTESQLIHWSVKETAFKYYSEQKLEYHEMRLQPFDVERAGWVQLDNLKTRQHLLVRYRLTTEYVLTFAY